MINLSIIPKLGVHVEKCRDELIITIFMCVFISLISTFCFFQDTELTIQLYTYVCLTLAFFIFFLAIAIAIMSFYVPTIYFFHIFKRFFCFFLFFAFTCLFEKKKYAKLLTNLLFKYQTIHKVFPYPVL
jgi:hypothetical protein